MQAPVEKDVREDREADDAELMRRIAEGDAAAFRQLMRRYLARTVRMAARVLGSNAMAEDVAQEAFVRVWRHAAEWKNPAVAGARFSTWLYRIVLNLCIDAKRKDRFSALDDAPEQVDLAGDGEQIMVRQQQAARVRAALAALPERQRQAFVLCFYEGYSNKEAAEMLGIGIKALESLLVRSKRTLRAALQGEERERL